MRLFDRIHEFKKIFLKREQENTEFIRNENLEKLMKFSAAIKDLNRKIFPGIRRQWNAFRFLCKKSYKSGESR